MKRELQVGDRVRVYAETGWFDGEIYHVYDDRSPSIRVRHDDGIRSMTRDVFAQQCRRLRKKPSPPAKGERVVYGVNAPRLELYAWEDAGAWVCSRENPEFIRNKVYYRVVGCSDGEVPITRDQLATALGNMFSLYLPKEWKADKERVLLNCFLDHFGMADEGSAK